MQLFNKRKLSGAAPAWWVVVKLFRACTFCFFLSLLHSGFALPVAVQQWNGKDYILSARDRSGKNSTPPVNEQSG